MNGCIRLFYCFGWQIYGGIYESPLLFTFLSSTYFIFFFFFLLLYLLYTNIVPYTHSVRLCRTTNTRLSCCVSCHFISGFFLLLRTMLSFFGDQNGKPPPKTTVVSKVAVRKPVPKSISSNPSSTPNRVTSHGGSHLAVPRSNGGSSGKSPLSRPGSSSSSSSSLKPLASKRPLDKASPSRPKISSPSVRSPSVKRKATVDRIQSESESSSSDSDSGASSSSSSGDALDPKPKSKRRRKHHGTSTNATPFPGEEELAGGRELFCLDEVDMRGEWGRGWVGFVGCEEVVRGNVGGWAGGNPQGGEKNLDKYQACE